MRQGQEGDVETVDERGFERLQTSRDRRRPATGQVAHRHAGLRVAGGDGDVDVRVGGEQAEELGAGETGRPDDAGSCSHRMIIRASAWTCNDDGDRTMRGRHGRMLPGSPPTKGRLLLATPPLEDPNFDRTVIYVLEHHDEGALGLVLNRPSLEQLGEPLDAWVELQTGPSQVFSGGPVEPDALIALARTPGSRWTEPDEHLAPLSGTIALRRLAADPPPARSCRRSTPSACSRGYSGSGPGQLEGEIDAGAWLVLDPEPTGPVHRRSPTSSGEWSCAGDPVASPGWPTLPTTSRAN